ncbi:hypothetical protein RhiirA4_462233 [Rhizophagus irregularis]|uniref:Uncharacterized protein n=1 Tax=Rhizophagus irregularis TaxID=588596 RepID=A0A2I1GKJ8_9GLOM|nr:hypothetical protein RhiirA4_462233 [Rhizophagus irregularis]
MHQLKPAFFNNNSINMRSVMGFSNSRTQNEIQFNELTRTKIIAEMNKIKISFDFWQEQRMQNWSYTSLMGGD